MTAARGAGARPADCRWTAELFHCVTHDADWYITPDEGCDATHAFLDEPDASKAVPDYADRSRRHVEEVAEAAADAERHA